MAHSDSSGELSPVDFHACHGLQGIHRETGQKLTIAGQESGLEIVETGGDGGGRLVGVSRQVLHVEMGHRHPDLFVDRLNFDGRFQVLRLVLDERVPPWTHRLLLGIDDDFVGEAGLEVDGMADAGEQPDDHQKLG